MPFLGIYSWDQYTVPSGIPQSDLEFDTHANDPSSPTYSPGETEWVGETFTFNGGAPAQIEVNDDDGFFEDAYVETGPVGQTLATGVTIDGNFYPAGSVVENEFSLIDGTGQEIWVVRIDGINVGFTYPDGEEPTAGDDFTIAAGLDGDPADNTDGTSSSTVAFSDVICFAAGTLIDTPSGQRRAEMLRAGDLVTTADEGPQPLTWVGQTPVMFHDAFDHRKPVILRQGVLGHGLPKRDLIVSPQHRILVEMCDAYGETDERFAVAKGMVPLPGVRIMQGKREIVYVHLMLERHAVLFAEGAPTESFYPGPMALQMIDRRMRKAVLSACPALKCDPLTGYGQMARPTMSVKETRAWARNYQPIELKQSA